MNVFKQDNGKTIKVVQQPATIEVVLVGEDIRAVHLVVSRKNSTVEFSNELDLHSPLGVKSFAQIVLNIAADDAQERTPEVAPMAQAEEKLQ